ncbi:TPA: ATP-binding protein, partial [Staphylococcus aureus]|nr:ATP-binding protein [Staphylococcus aureus]
QPPGKRKISFQIGETNLGFYEKGDISKNNKCEINIVVSNLKDLKKRISNENMVLISEEEGKKSKFVTLNDPLNNYLKLIEYI